MVLTGQIFSQAIQAISQGLCTAMVSNSLMNPGGSGHTATQAPQLMQAFHPMWKTTASFLRMGQIFL
jgi:hypothetical protein